MSIYRENNIGFTGTQIGCTPAQLQKLHSLMKILKEAYVDSNLIAHHGMCVGADKQFHDICDKLGIPLILHPGHSKFNPENLDKRADCSNGKIIQTLPSKSHFERNRDIGNAIDVCLFATPKTMREEDKGGTWYTVHYTRDKLKKYTIVVWPNGSVTKYNS